MKLMKMLALALVLMTLLHACSSESPTDPQETTAPPQTAEPPVQSPALDEQSKQQPSHEERMAALKALLPEGVTKVPETAEEIAKFPAGRFAGANNSKQGEPMKEFLNQLPPAHEADEETANLYFLALLSAFAENYPDPAQIEYDIKMAAFGSPEMDDPRYQLKEQYNVEIILDASGSMGASMGGQSKMEAAKEAILSFAKSLPQDAKVALRVYGHKGSGKDADKALSCSSTELVYGMQAYNEQTMQKSLKAFQPTGWTPIAFSLQEAQKDLQSFSGEKSTNMIYLVSDGVETCGGDPVAAAKQMATSSITPIVNVIGFDVDSDGQKQLRAVAEAAGGRYVTIKDQKALQKEFGKAREAARQWYSWRRNESHEAYSQKVDYLINNTSFKLEWKFLADDEADNLKWAIRQMERDDRFSKELVAELEKKQKERERLVNDSAKKLEDFLDSLTKKSYKETIEAIQKEYNANVNKQ